MAKKSKSAAMRPKTRSAAAIAKDGFGLPDATRNLKGFAMLSLRIALRAYFATFHGQHSFHVFSDPKYKPGDETDYHHSTNYITFCGQAVLHFQHLAELVCKDALRSAHDLLAINAESKPLLMLKLLRKEPIASGDYQTLNSVEFGEALSRVVQLTKASELGSRYGFIAESEDFLCQLNVLRNRLLHRGTFVLRYRALDELVGAYMLPFVYKVIELPEYSGLQDFWKYAPLKCGIDPMRVIADEWTAGRYEVKKIAFLKELGRAAYESPVHSEPMLDMFHHEDHARAEQSAKIDVKEFSGSDLRECPVCGLKTLVQYDDFAEDSDTDGFPIQGKYFPYRHRCAACTFEIDYHLDNPKDYGLDIPDLWVAADDAKP
jgi:hypothetical protein